jgi:hypothetical protein
MKKNILFLFVLMSLSVLPTFAGPGDPGVPPAEGDSPVGDTPVGAPIDGGAIGLLIAGAAYGVKKLKDKKK